MAVACLITLSLVTPIQRLAGFQKGIKFEALRRLHPTPKVGQRKLGISLGSINFCFQALVEKGWIKMQNFSQSKNKLRYAYLLTPDGVAEDEELQKEIEQLRSEISGK